MSSKVEEWTVLSMLEWGTNYFTQKDIPDPRLSIEWLLAHVLDVKRLDLYLKFDRPLAPDELQQLRPLVKRRATHEPLQYILGYTDFLNARIQVSPDVLIPRMETEQLVEIILDRHDESSLSVLDIGTGSGCIPVALTIERPDWQLSALDISPEALAVAKTNARKHNVSIDFQQGDILSWQKLSFNHRFDVIISNPPYVLPDEKNMLQPQVVSHEPATALFCNNLSEMYQAIIHTSEKYLKNRGMLYLEIHEQQEAQILSLFDEKSWRTTLRKDYENKSRFILAEKNNDSI